jgi:uncharacterized protein
VNLVGLLITVLTVQAAPVAYPLDFQNGDVTLKGTLYLPAGGKNCPVVVACHGSAPETRESVPYQAQIQELLPHEVGLYLYDKRGCGESGGTYEEWPPLTILRDDLIAAVQAVRGHEGVDKRKVGVRGLSQGGIIAPMAAAASGDIAFVIAESGPAVPIFENAAFQDSQRLLDKGISQPIAEKAFHLRRELLAYYATGRGYELIRDKWDKARKESWFDAASLRQAPVATPEMLAGPSFQRYKPMSFDIGETVANLKVPTLATFGSDDRHINVSRNVASWQQAAEKGRLSQFKLRVFYGAGHGLNIISDTGEALPSGGQHVVTQFTRVPGYPEFVLAWLRDVALNTH